MCVTGADDARELLGVPANPGALTAEGRTDDLTRVLDALSTRVARDVDDIARRSGLAPADVESLVGLAALDGRALRAADGWRRAPASG